jgi:hypothetical protein
VPTSVHRIAQISTSAQNKQLPCKEQRRSDHTV